MATILESLVNSWSTLIIAHLRSIEEVPENFVLGGVSYPLKQLVLEDIQRKLEAQ